MEPPGRIKLVLRGLSVAAQSRRVRAAFVHVRLPRPCAGIVDQLLRTGQRLLDARQRPRIGGPEVYGQAQDSRVTRNTRSAARARP